jgi:hypothetical protein
MEEDSSRVGSGLRFEARDALVAKGKQIFRFDNTMLHPPADSMAPTLEDVAATYNTKRALGLTPQDIADLAQYLKSL